MIISIFREIKEIFISGSSTGNKILFFLFEAILFLIISVVTGLLISYPIYYFGATPKYAESYKIIVSLGIVLIILSFFTYRFIKGFKEEWKITLSSYSGSNKRKWITCFIYSSPLLLPKWIKTFSYIIFGLIVVSLILLLFGKLILYFIVSFFSVQSSTVLGINEVVNKLLDFYKLFISQNTGYTILFLFEILVIMTIANGKSILEKNLNSVLGFWYFAFANAQFSLLYFFFYFLMVYKIIVMV